VVFADLDNDGDLDLVVTRNIASRGEIAAAGNELFRNDAERSWT
jgi:hypothetical protein